MSKIVGPHGGVPQDIDVSQKVKKDDFALLFRKAVERILEVTPRFVTDELPAQCLFHLNINEAFDELKETERTYPDIGMGDRQFTSAICESEVVSKLWIDGRIPVWIDISVYRTDSQFTYMDLLACNRFSASSTDYYYEDRGMGPFGIKSPIYPPQWDKAQGRFSLMTRFERFDNMRIYTG